MTPDEMADLERDSGFSAAEEQRETRLVISQETIDEVARVGREYPDGIHTCAELQILEPGRRPCTCGRCPPRRLR